MVADTIVREMLLIGGPLTMPNHPLKPCRKPGCPGTTRHISRYCEKHRSQAWRRRETLRANRWPYDTPRWKALRLVVIARDITCRSCAEVGRVEPIHTVDHRVPIANGGDPWAMSNLQGLCQPCHSRKTAIETGLGR